MYWGLTFSEIRTMRCWDKNYRWKFNFTDFTSSPPSPKPHCTTSNPASMLRKPAMVPSTVFSALPRKPMLMERVRLGHVTSSIRTTPDRTIKGPTLEQRQQGSNEGQEGGWRALFGYPLVLIEFGGMLHFHHAREFTRTLQQGPSSMRLFPS